MQPCLQIAPEAYSCDNTPYLEEFLCHIKWPIRNVNARLVWTATKNFPFVSRNPGGGVAVGGMAAHGLVNGMSGASPTGMSEANLPRPHLRRASETAGDTSIRNRGDTHMALAGLGGLMFYNSQIVKLFRDPNLLTR